MKKTVLRRLIALLAAACVLFCGCDLTQYDSINEAFDTADLGDEGIFHEENQRTSQKKEGCIGEDGIFNGKIPGQDSSQTESKEESQAESKVEESSAKEESSLDTSKEESSKEQTSKDESSAQEEEEGLKVKDAQGNYLSGWVKTYRIIPEHTETVITDDAYINYPALYVGVNNSEHTLILQQRLNELGYDCVTDGYYGESTAEVVSRFHADRGILASGSCSGNTWRALYSEEKTVKESKESTRYYVDPKTHKVKESGLQTIEGVLYLFEEDQMLAVGPKTYVEDGILYKIDENGVATESMTEALEMAKAILDEVGYTVEAAFLWCSTHIEYERNFDLYPEKLEAGISHADFYAEYSFETGIGMCFNYAACFYQMMLLLGYDPTYVEGYVPIANGDLNHHGWVEVVENGIYYVFDPTLAYESGSIDYCRHFEYGIDGTWIYCTFEHMENVLDE